MHTQGTICSHPHDSHVCDSTRHSRPISTLESWCTSAVRPISPCFMHCRYCVMIDPVSLGQISPQMAKRADRWLRTDSMPKYYIQASPYSSMHVSHNVLLHHGTIIPRCVHGITTIGYCLSALPLDMLNVFLGETKTVVGALHLLRK